MPCVQWPPDTVFYLDRRAAPYPIHSLVGCSSAAGGKCAVQKGGSFCGLGWVLW